VIDPVQGCVLDVEDVGEFGDVRVPPAFRAAQGSGRRDRGGGLQHYFPRIPEVLSYLLERNALWAQGHSRRVRVLVSQRGQLGADTRVLAQGSAAGDAIFERWTLLPCAVAYLIAAGNRLEGRDCQGPIRVHVHQNTYPVLVALPAHRALTGTSWRATQSEADEAPRCDQPCPVL
jgi:hypothetical protein